MSIPEIPSLEEGHSVTQLAFLSFLSREKTVFLWARYSSLSKTELGFWLRFPLGAPTDIRSCHSCLQDAVMGPLFTILLSAGLFVFPCFPTYFPYDGFFWFHLSQPPQQPLSHGPVSHRDKDRHSSPEPCPQG